MFVLTVMYFGGNVSLVAIVRAFVDVGSIAVRWVP